MPGPLQSDLHVDAMLTNMSIAYANQTYIADQIFPILPVAKQSDIIPSYDQSHWFRDGARLRLPRTKSEGGGWSVSRDTYFAMRYSFRDEISDEERKNADAPFSNLEEDAVDFVTDKVQMRREIAFATDFFRTGVWGADATGGSGFTQWSDYGASSPLTDITSYRDDIEARIGREPNTLVLGKQVWNQLRWHPDLIDTIKYTERGVISQQLAATLFEFEKFLIGRAIYTTDPEGTAEASVTYTRIWGKNALMVYAPPRASLKQPAAGYTFVWQVVPAALQYIKRMRDEEREVDIIEANTYFDQKATASRAGAFLANAVG